MANRSPDRSMGIMGATSFYSASASNALASSKIDEGYSDETRSQGENDALARPDARTGEGAAVTASQGVALPDWVMDLSEGDRSELGYAILRSLRTSSIANIVQRLNPLLHLDPLHFLPPEVTFQIFKHFDANTLLKSSMASRLWRRRALDGHLWRLVYTAEGWHYDAESVRLEEGRESKRLRAPRRRSRVRSGGTVSGKPRKRGTPTGNAEFTGYRNHSASIADRMNDTREWNEQHGAVEADASPVDDSREAVNDETAEDSMDIDEQVPITAGMSPENSSITDAVDDPSLSAPELDCSSETFDLACVFPPIEQSLFVPGLDGSPKVNWQYLYRQRRRLEDNWDAGRFVHYSLPHPKYKEEAHDECVYTIQYSGKYLVSGSRDRTVRIWDLESLRLVRPPLRKHKGSVLCLQFDDSPDEDIIVSGGSDTDVVVWRFSTGEIIRHLERAHSESVLNLRFDRRYLITCSKDKTIKIWNRKELVPTDADYPRVAGENAKAPSYIVRVDQWHPDSQPSLLPVAKPLPRCSLLMTLDGHNAAVNAIQVFEHQAVSASGDRTVKVWDLRTGCCLMTLTGHTKGIACVQFDGRRIVSGSSDNTIRIYDRATGAEVACLNGHHSLVRTVQARFGDLPGNEDDLEAQARAVDESFFAAQKHRLSPQAASQRGPRSQRQNAGSREPKDITAYGAKLPPGGGGTRWARIVSGSYDETIVIWKKDSEGKWVVSRKLRQDDGRIRGIRMLLGSASTPSTGLSMVQQQQQQQIDAHLQSIYQAHSASQTSLSNLQAGQQPPSASQLQLPTDQQVLGQHTQTSQPVQASVQPTPQIPSPYVAPASLHLPQVPNPHTHPSSAQPGTSTPADPQATSSPNAQQAQAAHPHYHHNHHHHHHHHHQHPPHALAAHAQHQHHGLSARIFKLQFDSRRIVCCSQDSRISVWDFANGDERLIEASKFFSEEQ